MHIATCRLLSEMGFYELEGLDQDGWPHWKLVKPIPSYALMEQELLLKSLAIHYFEDIYGNVMSKCKKPEVHSTTGFCYL